MLMKLVQLEGAHPLEKPKWEGNYLFPRQLFKVRAEAVGSEVSWGSLLGGGHSGAPPTLLCTLSLGCPCWSGRDANCPSPSKSSWWWKVCSLWRRTTPCSSPSSGSTWNMTTSATTQCRQPQTLWPESLTGALR